MKPLRDRNTRLCGFRKNWAGRVRSRKDDHDCVVRSIAIATGKPYWEVAELVRSISGADHYGGVELGIIKQVLGVLGFAHVAFTTPPPLTLIALRLGDGLALVESMDAGEVVNHLTAFKGGNIHDTFDCRVFPGDCKPALVFEAWFHPATGGNK